MTIELVALAGLAATLFASIGAQSLHTDLSLGFGYAMSSRDRPAEPSGPLGGRLERNVRNQIEGLAMFLPLVVVAAAGDISNGWTQGASLVYLASRAVYPFAYVLGLNPWRSVIWTAGFCALPVFAWGLFGA